MSATYDDFLHMKATRSAEAEDRVVNGIDVEWEKKICQGDDEGSGYAIACALLQVAAAINGLSMTLDNNEKMRERHEWKD